MAASPLVIANSALRKVGAEPITSLSDDTKSARLCNACYESCRDAVLIAHPWNFAIARKTLSASVTPPEFGYASKIPFSSDMLRVLKINDQDYSDDWVVEGRNILTALPELKVIYIKKETDTTIYPPTVDELIAWKMAIDIAYPLSQSLSLVQECKKTFNDELSLARTYDAQEGGRIDQIGADEWLNARL